MNCRSLRVAATGLVVAVAATGVALAQDPVPTVTITLTSKGAKVTGAEGLRPGVTTLAKKGSRGMALLELKAGRTVAQVKAALERGITAPAQARRYGTLVAGGSATLTLKPTTYVIIDITREPKYAGEFAAAGAPTTAAAPAPGVTYELADFEFEGPSTIPAGSTIRAENTGKQMHELVAARLKPGRTAAQVLGALRDDEDPDRFVSGFGDAVGAIDRDVVNDIAPLKAGRYVFICFLPDERAKNPQRARPHALLGMSKAVTVR